MIVLALGFYVIISCVVSWARMGKDKKEKKRKSGLADDILEGDKLKASSRVKQRKARQGEGEETVMTC